MKIQILISKSSWANKYKKHIKTELKKFSKKIKFLNNHINLKKNYDLNIIFSYFKVIPKKFLSLSKANIIPHESKLPNGRGMSPLTWQILENKNKIFFSLIDASSKIDNGVIYFQKKVKIEKNLIFDEIKKIQLQENLKLILKFIKFYKKKKKIPFGKKQIGKSTYYKRRRVKDSELNINDSIKNQFNLMRTADKRNYPTFFKIYGKKFKIILSKI